MLLYFKYSNDDINVFKVLWSLIFLFRNVREYLEPLDDVAMHKLTCKNFSEETNKKINWVYNMFQDWRNYRNSRDDLISIGCDLSDLSSVTVSSLNFAMCRFLCEFKKLDGSDFPPKTLYQICLCVQFFLETKGYSWRLLSDESFKQVKFTLDNVMKQRTSEGIGITVRQAQVLNMVDEDILWSSGLLGTHTPEVLLQTVMFTIGLSCSLRAGKEHYALRSVQFDSQFTFMYDDRGKLFFRYVEDIGLKTNKGGIKHRKVAPKVVDVYQIGNENKCPVRILNLYLSLLPRPRKCKKLYLQTRKNYSPNNWFRDAPVGENRLRSFVKDLCEKAGIAGFYTNHSLRATGCTRMYNSDIDEQVIEEISGHRSNVVRSYKQTSTRQRELATKCIFGETN